MKNYLVNPQTYTYMQAAESYSILVNEAGKKIMKSRPMKHYEAIFLTFGWFKVHRSYMVNPEFVNQISENRDYILLKNGTKLPISRRKLKCVSEWRCKCINQA